MHTICRAWIVQGAGLAVLLPCCPMLEELTWQEHPHVGSLQSRAECPEGYVTGGLWADEAACFPNIFPQLDWCCQLDRQGQRQQAPKASLRMKPNGNGWDWPWEEVPEGPSIHFMWNWFWQMKRMHVKQNAALLWFHFGSNAEMNSAQKSHMCGPSGLPHSSFIQVSLIQLAQRWGSQSLL